MNNVVNVAVTFLFLAFWTAAFVIFYHLTRFGVGVVPKRLSAIFLIGSVFLFAAAVVLYQQVDLTNISI